MIASAYSAVPTAVGSSRVGFRSYVTRVPSAITADDRALEPLRRLALAEVLEHELAGEDHRGRIHLVQALVPRRRAVRRLEDRRLDADVRARRDSEPADETGGHVADDVAVEVREHEHVELLGPLDELHAERVDEHLARGDLRVVLPDRPEDVEEEPVGELHDVRLRHSRDLAAMVRARVLEGEADDPLRRLRAHRLDGDPRAGGDLLRLQAVQRLDDRVRVLASGLVLDPRVQVLGVLADDDDVDVLVARADPGYVLQGRRHAYSSSSCRRATLTERKPVPIGVVIGPFSATPFSLTESSVSSGSGVPASSITSTPACRTSQSSSTPVASRTRRVASVSSGPVPSPGMRVTRWPMGAPDRTFSFPLVR